LTSVCFKQSRVLRVDSIIHRRKGEVVRHTFYTMVEAVYTIVVKEYVNAERKQMQSREDFY